MGVGIKGGHGAAITTISLLYYQLVQEYSWYPGTLPIGWGSAWLHSGKGGKSWCLLGKAGSSVGGGHSLMSLHFPLPPVSSSWVQGFPFPQNILHPSSEGHWSSLTITIGNGCFNSSLRGQCLPGTRGASTPPIRAEYINTFLEIPEIITRNSMFKYSNDEDNAKWDFYSRELFPLPSLV